MKRIDDRGKHPSNLRFVTTHKQGILECVLTHLPDLRQIFVQDFQLFFAGYGAAVRLLPFDWVALRHERNVSIVLERCQRTGRQDKQNVAPDIFLPTARHSSPVKTLDSFCRCITVTRC